MDTRDDAPHDDPRRDEDARATGAERGTDDLPGLLRDAERLDQYVERLRAERAPVQGAEDASPELTGLLPAAAMLRAAGEGAAEPRPEFVAGLIRRTLPGAQVPDLTADPARASGPTRPIVLAPRRGGVSRRGLLRRGAEVAAAAAVGLAAGAGIEHQIATAGSTPPSTTTGPWNIALVQQGKGAWTPVATVESVPVGGVRRFATDAVVGYLKRTDTGFQALSAACTHMGCLTAWNAKDRTFDCPCHGGRFREDGTAHPASPIAYRPLPAMDTKVEAGQVWVFVPATGSASAPSPSGAGSATPYNERGDGYRG